MAANHSATELERSRTGNRPGPVRCAWLRPALLVAAVVLVYGRSVTFDFCGYDDQVYVSENRAVLRPSWHWLVRYWSVPSGGVYIPLGYTANMAISALAQCLGYGSPQAADPRAFHLAAIALQCACTLLTYGFLRRLEATRLGAACGAALWALHPLQVESVAWISGMPGLVGAGLALAAMSVYLDSQRLRDASKPTAARRRWLAATALFGLALMAKPLVAAVPLILCLVDVVHFRRSWRASLAPLAVWFALDVLVAIVTRGSQPFEVLYYQPSWALRPIVALDALGFYMLKVVWPWPLTPDYGRTPALLAANIGGHVLTLLTPVALAATLIVLRPSRAVVTGCAVFVLALAPVLGLIPFAHQNISTVADRYMQIALLGPAWLAAWLVTRRPTRPVLSIIAVALLGSATLSFVQVGRWQDVWTLTEHGLKLNPGSATMAAVRGIALAADDRLAAAEQVYRRAVEAAPRDPAAHYALGIFLLTHGRGEEALEQFQGALQIRPGHSRLLAAEGMALADLGRHDEAIAGFRAALVADPNFADAHFGLARSFIRQARLPEADEAWQAGLKAAPDNAAARSEWAATLLSQGRPAEAAEQLRLARRLDPDQGKLVVNLAVALVALGRLDEAEAELRGSLQATPNDVDVLYNLGGVLARGGRHAEAIEQFLAALRIDATHHAARLSLSNSLAAVGRLDEALGEARLAEQAHPGDPLVHHQLGVLLDRAGSRHEALEHLRRAVQLAPTYEAARRDLEQVESLPP